MSSHAETGSASVTAAVAHDVQLPNIDAGGDAFDPWASLDDEHLPKHPRVSEADLVPELRALMRKGLPATAKTAGSVLPNLRSIIARSIHPYDASSRREALNSQLVRLIVEHDDEGDGRALIILFALAKGTRGTTLESRREKAAETLAYDVTHFRKRIEPKLLESLAAVVYADLLRYKRRVRRAPAAEEPTGDTPSITERDFTHEEELVSRIWSHVYALRAELIAAGRLGVDPAYAAQVAEHRILAERERLAVDGLLNEFQTTYGDEYLRHGEAEWSLSFTTGVPW